MISWNQPIFRLEYVFSSLMLHLNFLIFTLDIIRILPLNTLQLLSAAWKLTKSSVYPSLLCTQLDVSVLYLHPSHNLKWSLKLRVCHAVVSLCHQRGVTLVIAADVRLWFVSLSYPEVVTGVFFILMTLLWFTREPGFVPGWTSLFEK